MMDQTARVARIAAATEAVHARLEGHRPTTAIILGSGLGPLAERVVDPVHIPYRDIPGFHVPTILGHKGELVAGTLGGQMVLVQSGRFHMYEGHSAEESALPVRVFAALGIRTLVVTNAAGGINRGFSAGMPMLIRDHINLTGRTPLEGPVLPDEERFTDMSVAYDAELRVRARRVAEQAGFHLAEGVYAALPGPSFETPSEIDYLERIGADAVGMSTVMEVLVARARGMRVMGCSIITNLAAGRGGETLSHHEVMEVAAVAGERVGQLIEDVLREG